VRGPASAVGVVGFRPSLGLVSRGGVVPLDSTSDVVGPLAKSVADVAAVLDALVAGTAAEAAEDREAEASGGQRRSGRDRDFSISWSAIPASARLPGIHAAAAERGASSGNLGGIRLGVLDCALSSPPRRLGDETSDDDDDETDSSPSRRLDVLRLFNSSMLALESAGATVLRGFTIKGNSLGEEEWGCIPGAWPTGRRRRGEGEGEGGGTPLEDSRRLEPLACRGRFAADAEPYFTALVGERKDEGGFVRSVWESGRVHPAAAAPLRSHFDDGSGGEVPRSLKLLPERDPGGLCGCGALWDGDGSERGRGGSGSGKADPCRTEFRRRLRESMDATGVDAVALPTWTLPPRLLSRDDGFSDAEVEGAVLPLPGDSGGGGATGGAPRRGRAAAAAAAAGPLPSVIDSGNLSPLLAPPTGAPAVSLPMGFTEAPGSGPRGSSLLPAGLQLVGRPFGDAELVRVAAAVERALLEREEEGKGRRGGSGGGGGPRLPPPLLRECG